MCLVWSPFRPTNSLPIMPPLSTLCCHYHRYSYPLLCSHVPLGCLALLVCSPLCLFSCIMVYCCLIRICLPASYVCPLSFARAVSAVGCTDLCPSCKQCYYLRTVLTVHNTLSQRQVPLACSRRPKVLIYYHASNGGRWVTAYIGHMI